MLMLENLLNQDVLETGIVRKLHKFMPLLLNTYKETVNRQVGCQMKIIKFHLPIHFASDIQRFGSMKNFDTGIGESHHKTEAKLPAKNTQRRRSNFEFQTAKRQIENIAINIAHSNYCAPSGIKNSEQIVAEECKWFRYGFDKDLIISKYKSNSQRRQKEKCHWKDKFFQQQLEDVGKQLFNDDSVKLPLQFFAQYNRNGNIFRADPSYENNEPWYDWVSVEWREYGIIPAKLLLFWDISQESFQKPFQVGTTTVSSPGIYALAYSLLSMDTAIKAHGASHLVKYAELDPFNDLCIIPVESIHSPIIALPYQINDNIIDAKEWILLISKGSWKNILYEFMKASLSSLNPKTISEKSKKNKKRKNPSK